jgi:acyl carrier protein
VNSIDDFVEIVRNELGLPVGTQDAALSLDDVPGWDSLHLLTLLVVLERTTGRRISMPDVLQADSLHQIYELATAA